MKQITAPDGRTFMMVEKRQSRANWRKLAEMVIVNVPPGYKDWADYISQKHPTEDAEFEIIEPKQLTDGTLDTNNTDLLNIPRHSLGIGTMATGSGTEEGS